ncbi:MAG: dual specificity protein phosphatase family protein [Planctomycetota bacterium]
MIRRLPLLCLFAVVAIAVSGCHLSRNFHEVDPQQLYRSGQLTSSELEAVIGEHGIRTVINLRGARPETEWYRDEIATCARLDVAHVDLRMSAQRIPHREHLCQLLDEFALAERPILVHCAGGSDRTGLATAIYAIEYMGHTKSEALQQLSLAYFHVPALAPSKHYFLEIYEGQEWAYAVYDPCAQNYEYYDDVRYCQEP